MVSIKRSEAFHDMMADPQQRIPDFNRTNVAYYPVIEGGETVYDLLRGERIIKDDSFVVSLRSRDRAREGCGTQWEPRGTVNYCRGCRRSMEREIGLSKRETAMLAVSGDVGKDWKRRHMVIGETRLGISVKRKQKEQK